MFLKTAALGILNGDIPSSEEDVLEAYQFIVDNGYTNDLSVEQYLKLKELVESDKVFTPTLVLGL